MMLFITPPGKRQTHWSLCARVLMMVMMMVVMFAVGILGAAVFTEPAVA